MKRKKMYVSAVTGYSPVVAKRIFNEAERVVSDLGFSPVSPLNNGVGVSSQTICVIVDIIMMIGYRHVYFLRDWEYSEAADIKMKVAKLLRMKMYFETESYFVNKTKWHVVKHEDKTYRISIHKRERVK